MYRRRIELYLGANYNEGVTWRAKQCTQKCREGLILIGVRWCRGVIRIFCGFKSAF